MPELRPDGLRGSRGTHKRHRAVAAPKTGENLRETIARRIVAARCSMERSASFRKRSAISSSISASCSTSSVRFWVASPRAEADIALISRQIRRYQHCVYRSEKKIIYTHFDTPAVDGPPTDKINGTFRHVLCANGNLDCRSRHTMLFRIWLITRHGFAPSLQAGVRK